MKGRVAQVLPARLVVPAVVIGARIGALLPLQQTLTEVRQDLSAILAARRRLGLEKSWPMAVGRLVVAVIEPVRPPEPAGVPYPDRPAPDGPVAEAA